MSHEDHHDPKAAEEAPLAPAAPEEKASLKPDPNPMDKVTGPISILSFILTLPVLAAFVWLLYMKNYDCEELLKLPRLQVGVGVSLVFVFIVSNLVVFLRSRFPVPGLVVVMVPLIVMLTMGLSLVGAYSMESKAVPGSPMWLERKIYTDQTWDNIKSCIFDVNVCHDLGAKSADLKSYNMVTRKLSYIESGCCEPPKSCNMEYVNATFWTRQRDPERPYDRDCDAWENQGDKLCYNCESCKLGYTMTLQGKWQKLGMFLIFMSLLLIVSHLLLFLAIMWGRYRF